MSYRRKKRVPHPKTCIRESMLFKELTMVMGKYKAMQIVKKLVRTKRVGHYITGSENYNQAKSLMLNTSLLGAFFWGGSKGETTSIYPPRFWSNLNNQIGLREFRMADILEEI